MYSQRARCILKGQDVFLKGKIYNYILKGQDIFLKDKMYS